MWRNYFKLTLRNLRKDKGFSAINIIGLAVGLATCLLILLWVADELSYDRWNERAERIYRIKSEINFGGTHNHYAVAPGPMAGALRRDFPEVEAAVRFRSRGNSLVRSDVQNYREDRIIYADSTLFDVFSLKVVAGEARMALAAPHTVVITKSVAEKYFGGQDPVGRQLIFDDTDRLTVTAVVEDLPTNSHFHYDFFRTLKSDAEGDEQIWLSHNFQTYIILREGVNAQAFAAKMNDHLLERYVAPQVQTMMGLAYEDLKKSGSFIRYAPQPLTDIHLHSDLVAELEPNGNSQYVWLFLAAAFFVLGIAVVNFMNLSTARSARRAREIGVRKVMGSTRGDLVRQFLSESVLLTWLAVILGLVLAIAALPMYNDIADKTLRIPYGKPLFWAALLGGATMVGLVAGSYPALFLSRFQPVKILRGKLTDALRGGQLRGGLVVFQFFVATLLIIGSLAISEQVRFIRHKQLGFDRERVLILNDVYGLSDNLNTFKTEVRRLSAVVSATASNFYPVPSARNETPVCRGAQVNDHDCISTQYWDVDEHYFSTLGMQLKGGRNFDPAQYPSDSSTVLLNETLARKLFGAEDPVGKQLYAAVEFNAEGGVVLQPFTIIGMVQDFHFESLRQNIGGIAFFLDPGRGSLALKIQAGADLTGTINALERKWKELAPSQPFSYQFLDEQFDQMYRAEMRVGRIFSLFTGLSLFVACLGLFGLTAYAVERRRKEIGIRKVLGATSFHIVGMFSRNFLLLVLLAFALAAPLAWWSMRRWLEDFAYRAELGWWIFPLAAAAAVLVALLTVAVQSLRAAVSTPVASLRAE